MAKIIIIDDESHIRLLLSQSLEELEDKDVEILTAKNGKEGLELIKKESPDLVFLDVMMPEMDGFEVCRAVKKVLSMSGVYIIFLTAKGQEYNEPRI